MTRRVGIISRYCRALKNEAFAGIVLMIAILAAIVWSNSSWRGSYFAVSEKQVGLESVYLSLPIGHRASDGPLAVFFFAVGMEPKQEFATGSLRGPRKTAVPILAALCGMVGPIGVYIVVQAVTGSGVYGGWAVPVATDIAFALAILAIFGRSLPPAARTFLMTLAVADDLGGIAVIALFFFTELSLLWLGASIATVAVFGLLVRYRVIRWWILWPLGILAWYSMHLSDIYSTIAGVALDMMVSIKFARGEKDYMTHRFSERLSFASSGIVLPIFAFFAMGVNIVDSGGFGGMITDPVSLGIYLGLPLDKCTGIFSDVWVVTKFPKLRLGAGIDVRDISSISLVADIGFTVSLLIATLSLPANDPHEPHSRVVVIIGTLLSVVLGAVTLRLCLRSAIRGPGTDPHSHLRHTPNRREDGPRRDGVRGDRRGRRPKS